MNDQPVEPWMERLASSDEYDRRGYELCETGDFESALGIYEEGLALFPYTPELHSGRGHMLLYLGEFVQALASFRQGLVLSPLDPDLNKGAALSLLYLNRPDEAIAHLERARANFLDDDHTLFEIGYGLYQAGQFVEALRYLDGVVALNPRHTDAHLYRGLARHSGKIGEAEEKYDILRTALELDPDRPDLCEHFAHVLFEDGRTQEALALFERLSPDEVYDEVTLERMLEAYRARGGNRKKRWALRRRLKEIRSTSEVDEFIQELLLDWEAGAPPGAGGI